MNVISLIASRSSQLGTAAADIAGMVSDMSASADAQVKAFGEVGDKIDELTEANRAIVASALATTQEAARMKQAVGVSLEKAQALEASVQSAQDGILSINQTFRQVSVVADDIGKIALQTKLLSFNASVEAHRAGPEGKGFAVVASSMRELAEAVEAASRQITNTIKAFGARIEALESTMKASQGASGDGGKHRSVITEAVEVFHQSFASVEAKVNEIRGSAQSNDAICAAAHEHMSELTRGVQGSAAALHKANDSVDVLLNMAEEMIALVAESGEETADTPYIQAVQQGAEQLGQAIEASLARGEASLQDWFDTRYAPVQGSNPAQFTTRYCHLSDRLFPQVQEALLSLPGVVFCAAVDQNGYLPTHNHAYSQRPRPNDPAWNTANCRNRRIFNDRTGLRAGRNKERFLLQTYRRDMGKGQFALMKDLSAPIVVQGKHWGGLRLAYRID